MSTTADLVAALKKELKTAQMTYADLARALGMAESSVKRMLARGDMPLSRIDAICRALALDFADLARRVAVLPQHLDLPAGFRVAARQFLAQRRQRIAAAGVDIAEAVAVGMLGAHVVDRGAGARRRQQGGLSARGHRAEGDQEAVAVLAQVHRVAPVRQACGQAAHFGKETPEADALPGDHGNGACGVAGG